MSTVEKRARLFRQRKKKATVLVWWKTYDRGEKNRVFSEEGREGKKKLWTWPKGADSGSEATKGEKTTPVLNRRS